MYCILDGNRGHYIPQTFANYFARAEGWSGMDEEDIRICEAGPEDDWYDEAWHNILHSARYHDPDSGKDYFLWQDSDLFVVAEDEGYCTDQEWPPSAPVYK